MVRGHFEHTIDTKGRVSLPSRFRAVFSTDVVLTAGLDACLVVYPLREWVSFEKRLAALPQFDVSVSTLRRLVVSSASECEIDSVGRIVVPATLRDHAGLTRDVTWAGMGRFAELWSKSSFQTLRREALGDQSLKAAMAARLAELGL